MPEQSIELDSNIVPSTLMSDKRNIVFAGGGVRGIAYVGVRAALDTFGFPLDKIERVGGTSAGAINALAFALNLTSEETKQVLLDLNVNNLLDDEHSTVSSKRLMAAENRYCFYQAAVVVSAMPELHDKFGLYPGEYAREWLESVVFKHTQINFCTFKELHDLRMTSQPEFKDLYMVGFNTNTGLAQTFSADKTPDAIISDAIRISMSIPFLYQPHCPYYKVNGQRMQGMYDVALLSIDPHLSPVPTEIFGKTKPFPPGFNPKTPTLIQYGHEYWFYGNTNGELWKTQKLDSQKVSEIIQQSNFSENNILPNPQSITLCQYIASINAHTQSKHYWVDGGLVENYPVTLFDKGFVNPETLGFYLTDAASLAYLNDRIDDLDTEPVPEHVTRDFKGFAKSVLSGMYNRDYNTEVREHENQRTVYIDHCNIDATDFNLDTAHKQMLLRSGWNSVCQAFGRMLPVPEWLLNMPEDKKTETIEERIVSRCSIM